MRTLDFHRDNTPSTEIKRLKQGTQLEIKKSLRNVRGRQYYEKKELANESKIENNFSIEEIEQMCRDLKIPAVWENFD